MAAAPSLLLPLALLAAAVGRTWAVQDGDCYQFGSDGWDLIWWGEPGVRLPEGGTIPICASNYGGVVFRWRRPAGVFQIPSEECPGTFTAPFNATYQELAPVSDSNHGGFAVLVNSVGWGPGTYWVTSQVPGACESGVKVRIDVVGPVSAAVKQARTLAAAALTGLCSLMTLL